MASVTMGDMRRLDSASLKTENLTSGPGNTEELAIGHGKGKGRGKGRKKNTADGPGQKPETPQPLENENRKRKKSLVMIVALFFPYVIVPCI